jgi:hypothetical protein
MSENARAEMNNEVEKSEVKVDEPKTYSQEEVDNIVKGRLARQNDKIKDLKSKNAKLEADAKNYNAMSRLLSEKGGFKGSAEEQFKQAADYYEVNEEDRNKFFEDSTAEDMAFLSAKRFVDQADDDDKLDEYNRISLIPEEQRTLKDKEKYKLLKGTVNEMFEPMIAADKKWLAENAGEADFNKLIGSEEFKDFISGTSMKMSTAIQKFVKAKGADYINSTFKTDEVTKETPASTGSVKNSGASKLKEYYSPEDVDALTAKDYDDPEIMRRVGESMKHWR